MKKMVILFALLCAMTVCVFAQSYTVQSVKGRVEQENGNAKVEIKVGDTLSGDTVIYTRIGASVVLKEGDKSVTITANRNGKVSELVKAASTVQIKGNVAKTDTYAVTRTTAQASTASARASEAAGDADIAAE